MPSSYPPAPAPKASHCNRPKRLFILIGALWFLAAPAFAADGIVQGKVVDQSTGEPLSKVRVVLQGTDLQAVTDEQGQFLLQGVKPGTYTLYVSTVGYRLRKKEILVAEGESLEILFYLGQEATTITDVVHVTAPIFEEVEKTAASQIALTSTEIKNLAGVLVDDPLRSVQTLPGVAGNDDFQAYYSIRGGNYQNNGLVVDGALTHNFVHTIQGTQEPTGSAAIINGDLVESMALYAGGFSAKYGDRTASFLEVVTREGSRDRPRLRLAVSGTNAAMIAEGPLDQSKKGSWIISARKSYIDYLVQRIGPESDLTMGFGDLQGKIIHDASDRSRFGASFAWGRTKLGRDPAKRGVTSLIDGSNNVGLGNFSWRYLPNSKVLWESRLYLMRETFLNKNKNSETLNRGAYFELALRSDLSIEINRRNRFEAGTIVRFIESELLDRRYNYSTGSFIDYDSMHGHYRQTALFAQDRLDVVLGKLSAIIGVRMEATELTGQSLTNPRASLEWRLSKKQKIDAGWGIFSQYPEILPVLGRNGDPHLRAEVARHYILGYERLLGTRLRFRAELYAKEESDLVRSHDDQYRLVNGKAIPPDINFRYDNALRGHSRGFEVFLQRRSANRLTGWISYAYENSKLRDLVTREVYPGDFEQKHTINIYGSYRFSESWNLSLKSRFGSGFPYLGYFEQSGSDLYLASELNRVRLPYYSRTDIRINKAFYFRRSKLSLYLELLNIQNRENIRFDKVNSVNSVSRKVSYSKDALLPIIPTAGFVLEF